MTNKLTDEEITELALKLFDGSSFYFQSGQRPGAKTMAELLNKAACAVAELQERRKADNQEPAGYHVIKECGKVGCSVATLEEAEKTRDFWNKKWTIRPYFYSAQPVPVVPDEITSTSAPEVFEIAAEAERIGLRGSYASYAVGWNACRAALLQGAEPVSQTYELPELIVGMEVSIDVSTCDTDAGNRYFGTVTEVSELDIAKNGYILLVQDAEPNFDVNGNSPAIPDDWVMVPKEPTQAMIKAWLSEVANFRGHAAGYRAALEAAPQLEVNRG